MFRRCFVWSTHFSTHVPPRRKAQSRRAIPFFGAARRLFFVSVTARRPASMPCAGCRRRCRWCRSGQTRCFPADAASRGCRHGCRPAGCRPAGRTSRCRTAPPPAVCPPRPAGGWWHRARHPARRRPESLRRWGRRQRSGRRCPVSPRPPRRHSRRRFRSGRASAPRRDSCPATGRGCHAPP